FLEDVDVVDVAEPRAAVALREDRPQHAEAAELLDDLHREGLRLVPGHHVGRDLGGGKVADHRLDLALLLGQVEVHACSGGGNGPRWCGVRKIGDATRPRALNAVGWPRDATRWC